MHGPMKVKFKIHILTEWLCSMYVVG